MRETGVVDKKGKMIKVGDVVVRYCPCCDKIMGGGTVQEREDGFFVVRDYEKKEDTALIMRSQETGEQAELEIVG